MRTGTIDLWFYNEQGALIGQTRVTLAGINRVGSQFVSASYSGDPALISDSKRLMIYAPMLFDAWNTIQVVQLFADGSMTVCPPDPDWLAKYLNLPRGLVVGVRAAA